MSKYGVFSGLYFPVLGLNTEIYAVFIPNTRKYVPEKTPYLDTFHSVSFRCSIYVKFPSMILREKSKKVLLFLIFLNFILLKARVQVCQNLFLVYEVRRIYGPAKNQ